MLNFNRLPDDQKQHYFMRFLHAVARHYLAHPEVLYFEDVISGVLEREFNPFGAEA